MSGKLTERLADTSAGMTRAAAIIANGGTVAFPTETVYGLGADAGNADAVAAIYAAKSRPSHNPLIVHVASADSARDIAVFNTDAEALIDAFWPGALTLVLALKPGAEIAKAVTVGQSSIAVRCPDHPTAQDLLVAVGRPLAAPSANPSGAVSPTTAQHVLDGLDGKIDAVLDGGSCPVGVESTIVGLTGAPVILRDGGLPQDAIEACLGRPIGHQTGQADTIVPGQLASHYAPRAQLRLNAESAGPNEILLGFGAVDGATENLSPSGDLTEAAARLFAVLRDIDTRGVDRIAVSPIPDRGIGAAINDRLRRAAAPRDPGA